MKCITQKFIGLLALLFLMNFNTNAQDNYSLNFDQTSDNVQISAGIFNGLQNFTISSTFKANPGQTGYSCIFQCDPDDDISSSSIYTRYTNNDNQFVVHHLSAEVNIDPVPAFNVWNNITSVYSNDSIIVFLNGDLIGSTTIDSSNFTTSESDVLYIGNWEESENFNGSISDFQIWNTALTQQEIQNYMNCTPSGNEDGLIGYWNFNEGNGDTLYDISGNNNQGLINGAIYIEDVPENNCESLIDTIITLEGHTYIGELENSIYYISNDIFTWEEANEIATNLGGHLVTISSEEENQFIWDAVYTQGYNPGGTDNYQAWIGLYQNTESNSYQEPSGGWQWANGEEFSYSNWASDEPDNNDGGYFAHISDSNCPLNGGSENSVCGTWCDDTISSNLTSAFHIIEYKYGCTDSEASNYDETITLDDGSCQYSEDDELNYSMSFDGVDDRVDVGIGPDIYSSGQLTIEAWVKPMEHRDGQMIVSKGSHVNLNYRSVQFMGPNNTGHWRSSIHTSDQAEIYVESESIAEIGVWSHIALTYDGSKIKYYINGILEDEISASGEIHYTGEPFFIGDQKFIAFSNYTLNGQISEVRVWDTSLESSVISSNMFCPPLNEAENLIGHWNFNEGSGDTVYDISGNNNHGLINGATYIEDVPENNCNSINSAINTGVTFLGSFDGSDYYISQNQFNWETSNAFSNYLGGTLSCVTSESENNFIVELIDSLPVFRLWLGGIYDLSNGSYTWLTGEDFNYVNWHNSEPSSPGDENYLNMWGSLADTDELGEWNDEDNIDLGYALIEFPSGTVIYGCIDSSAYNYNIVAFYDDGSCQYSEEVSEIEEEQQNYSMSFDGIDDSFDIPEVSGIKSLTFWANISEIEDGDYLVDLRKDTLSGDFQNQGFIWYGTPSDTIDDIQFIDELLLNNSISFTGSYFNFPLNDWVFVYIELENETTDNVTFMAHHDHLGNNYSTGWGAGYIDEICFWEHDLTSNQIDLLMNCSANGNENGLLGYWNFNEGSGDSVYDISGNNNHGLINGASFSEDVPEQNCNESDDDINNTSYEIGDFTEGGIVFYVDSTGQRGLVAAMEDLPGFYEFGCSNQAIVGADGLDIGYGYQNTNDILNQECITQNGNLSAAQAASLFESNLYNDWYLPSIEELKLILNSNISSFQPTKYWSSTETGAQTAYPLDFLDFTSPSHYLKYATCHVRPIRSFGNWTMGCIDSLACNYNPEANLEDGSCTYPELFYDCSGELIPVLGCLNSLAINYDELADIDDGSCLYSADVYLDLLESNSNLEDELFLCETVEEEQDYSMSFDGGNDQIIVTKNSPFSFSENLSLNFDFSYNQTGHYQTLITYSDWGESSSTNSQFFVEIAPNDNQLNFIHEYGDGHNEHIEFQYQFEESEWYSVCITRDVNIKEVSLYVEGNLEETLNYTNNPTGGSSAELAFGNQYNSQCGNGGCDYDGKIDNIKIFDRLTSQEEIQSFMNCPLTGEEEGLVGYWNFNEGSGDSVYDISGNENHGIINGGGTYSTDVPEQNCDVITDVETIEEEQQNYSMSFDGEDDYTDINPNDDFIFENGFNISFWGKTNRDNDSESFIYFRNDNLPNNPIVYVRHSEDDINIDQVYVRGTESDYYQDIELPENEWFHFSLDFIRNANDGIDAVSIYLNGNLISQSEFDYIGELKFNDNTIETSGIHFGEAPQETWDNLQGFINSVQVWNMSIPQEEIQSYMICPPLGVEEGLVGYWNFNEGSGNTVYDLSGNENHGTIYGATYSEDVPEQNCNTNNQVVEFSNLNQIDGFAYGGFLDGSYYFVSQELASWEEANTICNSSGGYLASITSEEENDFISSLLNLELEDGWMGLTDYLNEGDWVWSNGELYEYNNWANNEPGGTDAANNYENYGLIHISGTWNDGYALTDHQYIMEIDAIYGCLDSEYYNYNSQANTDNGICMSYEEFIIDSLQQALAVFEPIQESQGYSMSFDGDDDYIRIEHNETLNLLSNMTVMSWVKLSENYNDHNTIIAKRDDSINPDGEHPWQLTTSLEEPYYQAMFSSSWNNSYNYSHSEVPIFDSYEWVNIASVIEGDYVKFYKNGIYMSTTYFPASWRSENNFDILIGSVGRSNAEYLMGKLDDILLFDFALSDEQVESYIFCTPTSSEEGLVGYWNFNEGSGDTVYDISGNGNHGIIYGGAEFSEDIPESFNGCTDENALNYDSLATCDNGSCVYEDEMVSNLVEDLTNAIDSINVISSDLGLANDSISSLTLALVQSEEDLSDSNDSINVLISNIDLATDSITSLLSDLDSTSENLSLANDSIDVLTNDLGLANDSIINLETDLELSEESLTNANDSIGVLTSDLGLANDSITSLELDLELSEESLSNANDSIDVLISEIDSANYNIDVLTIDLGLANDSISTLETDLDLTAENLSIASDSIDVLISGLGLANYNIEVLTTDIGVASDSILSLVFEISIIQSEISLLESQLDSTINELTQTQSNLEESIDDINVLTDSIVSLNELTTSLQAQLSEALENQTQVISIDLLEGWNIIGYTLYEPQDAVASFQEITDFISIVKNNAGSVYMPEFGFNGIGDLIPGQGYQIKLTESYSDFTYSDTDGQRIELTPTVPQWLIDLEVDLHPNDIRTLVKVVNILGQEVDPETEPKGTVLIYLYNDATVEKKIVK